MLNIQIGKYFRTREGKVALIYDVRSIGGWHVLIDDQDNGAFIFNSYVDDNGYYRPEIYANGHKYDIIEEIRSPRLKYGEFKPDLRGSQL